MADLERYGDSLSKGSQRIDTAQLNASMNTLTSAIQSMLELFKAANAEMTEEEKAQTPSQGQILSQLGEIVEQNKLIAEGMIALSDLVKERLSLSKSEPKTMFTPMGMSAPQATSQAATPNFSIPSMMPQQGQTFGPSPFPMPPGMPSPGQTLGMPPPPLSPPGMPDFGMPSQDVNNPFPQPPGADPFAVGGNDPFPPLGSPSSIPPTQPQKKRSFWHK